MFRVAGGFTRGLGELEATEEEGCDGGVKADFGALMEAVHIGVEVVDRGVLEDGVVGGVGEFGGE